MSDIYALTRSFPVAERFGLIAQLRRAAVSIPSNIAEGAARATRKEFAHFISMARGSVAEVETQLLIANRLGYCDEASVPNARIDRLYARLSKLHRVLRNTGTEP